MKKFSSFKRQTSDKRLGVIVCFAFLFLCQETFVSAQDNSQPEPPIVLSFKNRPEPLPCPERKTTNFTGRLTAFSVLSECIPGYLSEEGIALAYKMAQGKYDEVIEGTQKSIKANISWWEDASLEDDGEKDNVKIMEMQRLMANAYELKGDWENAFRAYEVFLGELSEDYSWITMRRLYVDDKREFEGAISTLTLLFLKEDGENVRRISEAIKQGEEEYRKELKEYSKSSQHKFVRRFRIPPELAPTWRRVWTFRDRCARIICPEIYYVTSLTPQDNVDCFPVLQKEMFESLIEIQNGAYLRLVELDGKNSNTETVANGVEFLRLLDSIPYDLSWDGLYYEYELNMGKVVPIDRGEFQPFFIERSNPWARR